MKQAAELVAAGVRVIDLAADFPHPRRRRWQGCGGMEHARRNSSPRRFMACPGQSRRSAARALLPQPGLLPTAVQLGFPLLVEAGLIDNDHLIADAKSGVSGRRRKPNPTTLLPGAADSFKGLWRWPDHPSAGISQGLALAAGGALGPSV